MAPDAVALANDGLKAIVDRIAEKVKEIILSAPVLIEAFSAEVIALYIIHSDQAPKDEIKPFAIKDIRIIIEGFSGLIMSATFAMKTESVQRENSIENIANAR